MPSRESADPLEVIPRTWDSLPVPQHSSNKRKLAVAQQQLQLMIATAEQQCIDGRRFYGKLHLVISVKDGNVDFITGFPEFSDRASGASA